MEPIKEAEWTDLVGSELNFVGLLFDSTLERARANQEYSLANISKI
jgi:hypothetical protein